MVAGLAGIRVGPARSLSLEAVDDDKLLETARGVAGKLNRGALEAIQWTKRSMNLFYKQHAAIFDASLGLEFLGFRGPDVLEGLTSHKEKRKPDFSRKG